MNMKTQIANVFAIFLLVGTIGGHAGAVQSLKNDKPKSTTLLAEGLESKLKAYREHYKTEKLEHFHFRFDQDGPINEMDRVYRISADPSAVFAEILNTYKENHPHSGDPRVIDEYKLLQENILNRGFESSQNPFEPSPYYLQLYYEKKSAAGPQLEASSKIEPNYYLHIMTFELVQSYQRKGRLLGRGDDYPQVFLRGEVYFQCEEPLSKCQVGNVGIRESGIRWQIMPSPRGGSSTGG